MRNILRQIVSRQASADDGGITVLMLLLLIAMLCLGGLAIDTSQAIAARTQLQIAADSAAHAALYKRDTVSAADAKAAALKELTDTMPVNRYGTVLKESDIHFGRWDARSSIFHIDEKSRQAVLVSVGRTSATSNSLRTFLLKFAGMSHFDLQAQAVFTTFRPACFREGFVAEGIVDLQSNNGFHNGFCVHSNTHVSLNQNNSFEPGTVVSMPDTTLIDLPQSGFKKNIGLEAALREGYYRMRLIAKLEQIISDLGVYGTEVMPKYINNVVKVTVTPKSKKIDTTMFTAGRIHTMYCSGGGAITVQAGTYSKVVLTTNCELKFANGAALEDAIFATTSTSRTSVTAPNGMRVGKKDNCQPGGEAMILSLGSMNFASGLEMYNGQLIAKKDISFAANANGIMGASMIAGGEISGTSNMNMGFCGSGMDTMFQANYFRLAM